MTARKPAIIIPESGVSTIPVERGAFREEFTVDFDDARKLHAFLEMRATLLELVETAKDTEDEAVADKLYQSVWESILATADLLLGKGACERIFGGNQAVFGGLVLLTGLAEKVGPAYDAMFGHATIGDVLSPEEKAKLDAEVLETARRNGRKATK